MSEVYQRIFDSVLNQITKQGRGGFFMRRRFPDDKWNTLRASVSLKVVRVYETLTIEALHLTEHL